MNSSINYLARSLVVVFVALQMVGCSEDEPAGLHNEDIFEKRVEVGGPRIISGFIEKREGGFYGVGSRNVGGRLDPFVVSFDQNGDTLWTWKKVTEDLSLDQGGDIIEMTDGGCMVLLKSSIILFDAHGTIKKEIDLFSQYQNLFGQIVAAHDGGYLMNFVNYSTDGSLVRGTSELLRFNENLDLLWKRDFSDKHNTLIKTFGNGYALSRWRVNDYSFKLVNNEGVETNVLTYGGASDEILNHLAQKADGGFLLSGFFSEGYKNGYFSHTYIISTNNMGEIVWQKEFYNGVSDAPRGIIELDNKDIVFIKVGAQESRDSDTWPGVSPIFSRYKLYLTRTNSRGDVVFETTFDEADPDMPIIGARLLKTRKGYAILAGISDGLLIKEFSK